MPRIAPLFRSLRASTSALAPLAAKPTPAISRLPSASAFSSFARPTSILSALRPSVSPLASTIASSSKPTPSAIWSGIGSQVRFLTYGTTYQPSQRKRKRKHGFLVRLKGGRLGKNILARRRMKGRRFLSH